MKFLSNGVLKATPNQKLFCAKMVLSKKLILCYLFCFKKVFQIEFLQELQKSNFLDLKWSGNSQSKLGIQNISQKLQICKTYALA